MGVKNSNEKHRLYLRLPVRIKEESQIKDLHKNIEGVKIPRQNARWCLVEFASKEKLNEAIPDLKKATFGDKKVVVKPFDFKEKKDKGNKERPKPISGESTKDLKSLLKK